MGKKIKWYKDDQQFAAVVFISVMVIAVVGLLLGAGR